MRRLVALSSIALACAACGGGSDDEQGAASRAIEPDATERAEYVVLKLSDFPDGWRASSPEDDDAGGGSFRRCIGVDYSKLTFTGDAESQDFAMGENTEVSSDARVFKTEAEAVRAVEEYAAGMASEAAEGCVKELIEDRPGADQDLKVGEVDVGELSFTAPAVDEARAWQIAIPFDVTSGAAEGLSVTAYLDIIQLREGDTVVSVQSSDVLTPFDSSLRQELVAKVADRMTDGTR